MVVVSSSSSGTVRAGAWGLLRVARQELPGVPLVAVEILPGPAATVRQELLEAAAAAAWRLGAAEEEELQLEHKGSQQQVLVRRVVRHHAATALGAACAGCTGGALLPWAAGGSFLVSGGLGGLGLVSALALREAGATSLALLSRSGAARAGRSAQLLEELRAGPGD
ncbi:unnamed protein product [Polarella glacialis]|uniref:Ketoreductase (KR) domain-containing protein n=1 Tax=Polarella glacialis TaxID=89957 RepID=A0A813KEI5_POLGL|nr:unnamed protein product [Polarella glacialis]